MRPAGSYRGSRRNEAKKVRKQMKRRTVGSAMISYMEIQRINQMSAAREKAAAAAAAAS
jgi:GTP cyclohydrolase II